MNCAATQRRLWDEGPLPAEVLEHVAVCPACAARAARAAQVFGALHQAGPAEDPGNMLPAIQARLDRIGTPPSMFPLRALTAIAVTVMTLSLAWVSHAPKAAGAASMAAFGAMGGIPAGTLVASHRAGDLTGFDAAGPRGMLLAGDGLRAMAPRNVPAPAGTAAVATPVPTIPGMEPAAAVSVGAEGDDSVSEWETRGVNPMTGECTMTRVRTIRDAQGRVIKVEVAVIALP